MGHFAVDVALCVAVVVLLLYIRVIDRNVDKYYNELVAMIEKKSGGVE